MRRRGSGDPWALFAFIIVLVLGAALALTFILGFISGAASFGRWIADIAIAAALIIPLVISFREARRRGTALFVLWIIALILIIVFYVLLRSGPWIPRWRG